MPHSQVFGTRRYLPERFGSYPGRLGRHVNHDARNIAYQVQAADIAPPTVFHQRYVPVLDQGNLGACEGNGSLGVLGSGPFYGSLAAKRKAGFHFDETKAVALYSAATQIDPFDGAYPPDDTGTDNTSVATVLRRRGLISRFEHAYTLQAAYTAIVKGPLLAGFNWYEGMDTPDRDGTVHVTGSVRGGHAFAINGRSQTYGHWKCWQSWGPSFGLGGIFYLTDADLARLLAEDGELTAFAPPIGTPIGAP